MSWNVQKETKETKDQPSPLSGVNSHALFRSFLVTLQLTGVPVIAGCGTRKKEFRRQDRMGCGARRACHSGSPRSPRKPPKRSTFPALAFVFDPSFPLFPSVEISMLVCPRQDEAMDAIHQFKLVEIDQKA